jgi:hypothetical protein
MKRILATAAAIALSAPPLTATVTINLEVGRLRDSSSSILANQSFFWAVIYDENNDDLLPGGLEQNSSLVAGDAATAFSDFAGATLDVDALIAGDKVVASGTYAGEANGVLSRAVNLTYDDGQGNGGVVSGRSYGVYFFPSLTNSSVPDSPFEIGGLNELVDYTGSDSSCTGTQIPVNGATVSTGIGDGFVGGKLADSRFTAITAVPEPSGAAAMLTLLFGAGLLRHRRPRP